MTGGGKKGTGVLCRKRVFCLPGHCPIVQCDLANLQTSFVVLEATGGYETELIDALLQAMAWRALI